MGLMGDSQRISFGYKLSSVVPRYNLGRSDKHKTSDELLDDVNVEDSEAGQPTVAQ